ncbi:MAG: hypothetical protein HBSAPP02_25130 [Phycisphaerae bacterium]|nr:MAG: PAS domain-containing protein [Planctomycetia bacterium]RIK69054.1 MAG: hypothetical protein DCC66_09275 [Planctomycetota bacterium]GJQ27481.1 MAG: hypothetical protein HBSAPP02_25130 [Phycisphaerae bacterium]
MKLPTNLPTQLHTNRHPLTHPVSLDRILSNAADGVFVIDRRKCYVFVNDAFERLTGFARSELMDRTCACNEIIQCRDEHGRPLGGFLCPARSVFDGDTSQALLRMQISHRDGRILWVETHYSPIRDPVGRIEFVLGMVRDVSESKAHMDELKTHMADLRRRLDEPSRPIADSEKPDGDSMSASCERDALPRSTNSTERTPLDRILEDVERREILRALEAAGGQRTLAAQIMGISRSRLYRRLDALGLDQAHLD